MKLSFTALSTPSKGVIVFPVAGGVSLSGELAKLDKKLKGAIKKAAKAASFTGKKGTFAAIYGGVGDLDAVVLAGVGKGGDALKTVVDVEGLGGKLQNYLNSQKIKEATIVVDGDVGKVSANEAAAHLAYGALLKSYRFDKYFTKQKEEDKPKLTKLSIACDENRKVSSHYKELEAVANGVFLARDVVSEPPNVLYPESYADILKKKLKPLGVKVTVLGEAQMEKLGMGSLLSVGDGSRKESKLVVMEYKNGKKSDKPVAFVGKGVTFDTGGISIKPSNGMEDMKYDMGGSASVVGTMCALAGRKAKVNAIGVVGLVENMPDGNATRPSDVVTSMSGQTIEILNTDAEGRLVLADALWYTQEKFKPQWMIDLATLTGAMVVALGQHRAGIFSNNDKLSENIHKVGEKVKERVWRMPMGDEYNAQMDSKIADVQNISNMKGAGSITAAQFLERFVNDTPWLHIDIAGVAWHEKGDDVTPQGASGYGVRLLNALVKEHYES